MRSIGRAGRVLVALLVTGCGSEARLQRIELSPEVVQVTEHLQAEVTATAIWDDGARRDVTAEATWSSQDETLASVEAGLVRAGPPPGTYLVAAAGTNLTAAWGGLQASARVELRPATLRALEVTVDGVVKEATTLAAGLDARLVVLGTYSDGSVRDVTGLVTWSDDHDGDDDPMQIDLDGRLHAEAEDAVILWATLDGQVHELTLQVTAAEPVSLELVGLEAPVPVGEEVHLRVLAWLTDGSSVDVTGAAELRVLDGTIAELDEDELEGLRAGSTEVRASYRGLEASATLRVSAAVLRAIEVVPPATPLVVGTLAYFTARGTWSDGTTAPLTAEVDWRAEPSVLVRFFEEVGHGCVLPMYAGTVTIVASRHDVEGRATVAISPKPAPSP